MDSAIHVGNIADKTTETLEAVSSAICTILAVGHETHSEQQTIREALQTLSHMSQVSGVTITNSNFTGDKVVNMGEDEPDFGLRA